MENIIKLAIFMILVVMLSRTSEHRRVLWITSLCYFPLILTFMGRDALTVSTLCIYLFVLASLIRKFANSELTKNPANLLILILVLIGALSTLSVPRGELTGPAIRRYSDFVSSLFLFYYVTNLTFKTDGQRREFVEKLLSLTLIMVSIQIIISVFVGIFPSHSGFLNYFQSSKSEGITYDLRANSLMFSPEAFGEFLAVISPIALYKCLYRNRLWYSIILALMCVGLVMSGTRSGIVLFAVAMTVVSIYNFKKAKLGFILPFAVAMAALVIIASFFPSFADVVTERFMLAYNAYESGDGISTVVNRSGAWNLDYVLDNINLFGHGLIPTYFYGKVDFYFHNLYQTIVFQLGIIGAFCFFLLLSWVLKKTISSLFGPVYTGNKALVFSAFISLCVFFTNEFKYEFNRHEAYQQVCWTLLAIYWLLSHSQKITAKI